MDIDAPIFLFTGFLDSGKSSLIKDTLYNSDFAEGGKVLLVSCEDGDVGFEEDDLKKHKIVKVDVEDEEDFTYDFLKESYLKYMPDFIFIEYNGTWEIAKVTQMNLELAQVLTTIEGPTFEMYLMNMGAMMRDQMFLSDVIIINRVNDLSPKAKFRMAIKGVNRRAQIVYEKEDGTIDENAMSELPYDKEQKELFLTDADYAMFFSDIMEHPKDYKNKKVHFKALVYHPENYARPGQFVSGRFAMTCCVEDIQYLGLICKSDDAGNISHKSWIDLGADVKYEYNKDYGGKGPVLYVYDTKPSEAPEDELVYFT